MCRALFQHVWRKRWVGNVVNTCERDRLMKVHLKQIPAQGLHLEGEEDCPIQELESEGIRCVGRLHYDLDLGVAGLALWANGSLSQPVELFCVSCQKIRVRDPSAGIRRTHGT